MFIFRTTKYWNTDSRGGLELDIKSSAPVVGAEHHNICRRMLLEELKVLSTGILWQSVNKE